MLRQNFAKLKTFKLKTFTHCKRSLHRTLVYSIESELSTQNPPTRRQWEHLSKYANLAALLNYTNRSPESFPRIVPQSCQETT